MPKRKRVEMKDGVATCTAKIHENGVTSIPEIIRMIADIHIGDEVIMSAVYGKVTLTKK